MKAIFKKISEVCKIIFGYGVMISLFVGGLTFFGYVAAMCIGGELAAAICVFLYKQVIPVVIYLSTIMILFGLVAMYMAGESALTPSKRK